MLYLLSIQVNKIKFSLLNKLLSISIIYSSSKDRYFSNYQYIDQWILLNYFLIYDSKI